MYANRIYNMLVEMMVEGVNETHLPYFFSLVGGDPTKALVEWPMRLYDLGEFYFFREWGPLYKKFYQVDGNNGDLYVYLAGRSSPRDFDPEIYLMCAVGQDPYMLDMELRSVLMGYSVYRQNERLVIACALRMISNAISEGLKLETDGAAEQLVENLGYEELTYYIHRAKSLHTKHTPKHSYSDEELRQMQDISSLWATNYPIKPKDLKGFDLNECLLWGFFE